MIHVTRGKEKERLRAQHDKDRRRSEKGKYQETDALSVCVCVCVCVCVRARARVCVYIENFLHVLETSSFIRNDQFAPSLAHTFTVTRVCIDVDLVVGWWVRSIEHKRCKQGCPLSLERSGHIDPETLVQNITYVCWWVDMRPQSLPACRSRSFFLQLLFLSFFLSSCPFHCNCFSIFNLFYFMIHPLSPSPSPSPSPYLVGSWRRLEEFELYHIYHMENKWATINRLSRETNRIIGKRLPFPFSHSLSLALLSCSAIDTLYPTPPFPFPLFSLH
jgi:hypothetical protein